MTKYVTTEEQLQCSQCEISCAERELNIGRYCPNCGRDFSIMTVRQVNGRLEFQSGYGREIYDG